MSPDRVHRVLVIGDTMVDLESEYGAVRSDQGPDQAPVVYSGFDRRYPGGAANLAANLAAQGIAVDLISAAADDAHGSWLRSELESVYGVREVVRVPCGGTTTKHRHVLTGGGARRRVLCRVDDNRDADSALVLSPGVLSSWYDAIVVSDYGRGLIDRQTVQTISGYADELGVPVYADPRLGREHLWAGSGVGVMCMNGPEFSGFLSGCPAHLRSSGPQSVDALRAVSGLVGCSILIVKLGPDGAVRYQSSTGTVSRQAAVDPGAPVVDPNGAGDTFLAATVRADLQGLGRADALLYAAAAAGAAVSVPGTAVVMRARALDVLRPHVGAPRGVVSLDDAARLAQRLKAFGYRIGYTNGCFDLSLTPGHSHVIERASGACDFLFVGVDSDARVRKLKGPQRPIVSEEQRVRTISSLRPVYAAFVFETCPSEVVLRLRPDFLFKGSSYALESMPEREAVEAVGCSFINLGTIDCPSTTNVLARVSRGSPL